MKNKEKHYVSVEGKNEYVIKVKEKSNGTSYKLFTTESTPWTPHYQNKKLLSIFDDGNGFVVEGPHNGNLDYADLFQLEILINFISGYDSKLTPEYEIFKSK